MACSEFGLARAFLSAGNATAVKSGNESYTSSTFIDDYLLNTEKYSIHKYKLVSVGCLSLLNKATYFETTPNAIQYYKCSKFRNRLNTFRGFYQNIIKIIIKI